MNIDEFKELTYTEAMAVLDSLKGSRYPEEVHLAADKAVVGFLMNTYPIMAKAWRDLDTGLNGWWYA